jgi:alkane 1-monooxygenase
LTAITEKAFTFSKFGILINMKSIKAFKYLSPFIIYAGALRSFMVTGFEVWLPLIYAWVVIPLAELMMKPNPANMSEAEEELARADRKYDFLLFAIVLLQYVALGLFLYSMTYDTLIYF